MSHRPRPDLTTVSPRALAASALDTDITKISQEKCRFFLHLPRICSRQPPPENRLQLICNDFSLFGLILASCSYG